MQKDVLVLYIYTFSLKNIHVTMYGKTKGRCVGNEWLWSWDRVNGNFMNGLSFLCVSVMSEFWMTLYYFYNKEAQSLKM